MLSSGLHGKCEICTLRQREKNIRKSHRPISSRADSFRKFLEGKHVRRSEIVIGYQAVDEFAHLKYFSRGFSKNSTLKGNNWYRKSYNT